MPAILFGSISTIADTSELQRGSFNKAFAAHDLGWSWSRADYLPMLTTSGGRARIASYAHSRGEHVDAQAVHATETEMFANDVAAAQITPRPDVAATITTAHAHGIKVALVTTTSARNINALLDALHPYITPAMFDLIVDGSDVQHRKPAGDAYRYALLYLREKATNCVAIEDNIDGVTSAHAARLTCVAFPNHNTARHDFPHAQHHTDHLHFKDLFALLSTD